MTQFRNPVYEMLRDPHKWTHRAQGILCYLFRDVLKWRQVGITSWNQRTRKFFEKPHNKNNQDKGNLNKSLTQDNFTWPAFKKAIDFLNPYKAVLTIQLTWGSGRVSRYPILIDPAIDESEEDDPLKDQYSEVFDDKKKPDATLSRLFRRIVTEEGIDLVKWNKLFEDYVNDPLHGVSKNKRDRSTVVSSLQRDLLSPKMSWNVFRKGVLLLKPVKEDYILEVQWSKDPDDLTVREVNMRDPLTIKPSV